MRGESPIARPTIEPTTSASANPIARRSRLTENAATNVPSRSCSHIASPTSAGVGSSADSVRSGNSRPRTRSMSRSCHATRKSTGAVIRAARGVTNVRWNHDRLDRTTLSELTVVSIASSYANAFGSPAEEPALEPLEDESFHHEREPDEEERPGQHAGDVEEQELDADLDPDAVCLAEELRQCGDLPGDREAVADRREQERGDRRQDDVPDPRPPIDAVRRRHVHQIPGDRANAFDDVHRDVWERGEDDRDDRPDVEQAEDHHADSANTRPGVVRVSIT